MFEKLMKMAFEEDLGDLGDVTSDAIFCDKREDTYWLVAKQDGILCGLEPFTRSFHHVDSGCRVEFRFSDGERLRNGDRVAKIEGATNSLMRAERVALNFISHLSGIATQTALYVKALSDAAAGPSKTAILDTRKTLPGWRSLQKYAVKCGGGSNHRMGLYDMVLIKDNHIDGVSERLHGKPGSDNTSISGNSGETEVRSGISEAVAMVREKWKDRFRVEVETRNLREVEEALKAGADIIMLDNMDLDTMRQAVRLIDGRAATEASGNMTLERVALVAGTGVDYISIGALTHSVTVFDFSLRKMEG